MTVRSSMASLIFKLRAMTETEKSVETLQGEDLWTDERLQVFLDQVRTSYYSLDLIPVPLYVDGTRETTIYQIPLSNTGWFEPAGDDSPLVVVDILGNEAPTHTIDLDTGTITFSADTSGRSYYLRGSWYNLKKAAAEIWLEKAAQRAQLIEWKAGQHSLKEDDEFKHCMTMYKMYAGGVQVIRLRRAGYADSV